MRKMLQQDAILTLGSDSKSLNWQPLWEALLDEDDSSDSNADRVLPSNRHLPDR